MKNPEKKKKGKGGLVSFRLPDDEEAGCECGEGCDRGYRELGNGDVAALHVEEVVACGSAVRGGHGDGLAGEASARGRYLKVVQNPSVAVEGKKRI